MNDLKSPHPSVSAFRFVLKRVSLFVLLSLAICGALAFYEFLRSDAATKFIKFDNGNFYVNDVLYGPSFFQVMLIFVPVVVAVSYMTWNRKYGS